MSGERYGDFDSLAFEGCMCLEDRNGLLVKEIGMYKRRVWDWNS
jgi:hypothetical protein